MTYSNIRQLSFSLSVVLHFIIASMFFFMEFTTDYPVKEYVELSFGGSGDMGSSGAMGTQIDKMEDLAPPAAKVEEIKPTSEVKEAELPKTKTTEDKSVVTTSGNATDKAETSASTTAGGISGGTGSSMGQGNGSEGDGSFGFDINWGGKGTRKIYNYPLPAYPEGVDKEFNIRLKFSIKPDGTVGTILPLTKADTKLENAAINSLRQWRFEPLSPNQKQLDQTAVIVFPYRLQ